MTEVKVDLYGFSGTATSASGRLISAIVICVAAGIAVFKLADSRTDAERLVDEFVAELNDRDAEGAAALTSYPNAASATLTQLFDGLSDGTVEYDITQLVELSGESGYFTLAGNWNFGPDKNWSYQVDGSVKKLAVGWRVSWNPRRGRARSRRRTHGASRAHGRRAPADLRSQRAVADGRADDQHGRARSREDARSCAHDHTARRRTRPPSRPSSTPSRCSSAWQSSPVSGSPPSSCATRTTSSSRTPSSPSPASR